MGIDKKIWRCTVKNIALGVAMTFMGILLTVLLMKAFLTVSADHALYYDRVDKRSDAWEQFV